MRAKWVWGAAAVACLIAGSAFGQADVIKLRQLLMQNNEQAGKVAVMMIRGTIPYNAEVAAALMGTIAHDNETIPGLMLPGTNVAPSKATPAVFADPAAFKAASLKMAADAKNAAAEAAKGPQAFRAAFGAVAQNCENCHEKYRRE